MDKTDWFVLVVAFFVAIFLTAFFTGIYVNSQVTQFERNRRYCVVYGYATDYFLKQPVENVTVMFFIGDYKEIPYTNATYLVSTDAKGFYIDIMPLYQGHEDPEVLAVKDGYFANPPINQPRDIMEYGYIEPMRYQFTLYRADFQMVQFPITNHTFQTNNTGSWKPPVIPIINMTSTVFSKLDGSYLYWDIKTDPDFIQYLAAIQIGGGRGNNTQVTIIGMFPTRVDLTFFNGTNIAYTSYYPRLHYWTEPEIVKGQL